ncbi:MAG: alpha-galactosidase [Candidatus Nealsonbacteria bacterium]|nr:alpha-galactosidase [Candidatus Nealsonbacteria bacterium]
MAKIAIIGAGSMVFSTTLTNDILQTPGLEGSTVALMDPALEKTKSVENYVNKVIKKNNLSHKVFATADKKEAIQGADYVITTFQIGGMEAYKYDYEIPMKYGVDQCLGQCVGPGGVFRGLRTIPVLVELIHDMEAICPNAILLNYVNPMCTCSIGMGMSSEIPFVGLCHGIQTTLDLISGYVGVKKDEIDFLAAGINHMAWFLKLEKDGQDLYPIFRENIEKPEYYINDKVRIEVARHFGYFMTESTGHLSEYLYWFRKNRDLLDTYCDQPAFGGASGAYYKYCCEMAKKYEEVDILSLESGQLEPRSIDYCSYIIEALETGKPFRLNGNVINHQGYISNLPREACVEVPIYVDKSGLHPLHVGRLPSQLAALNRSNVTLQMLAAEAALTGDGELAFAAVAMDPLTSAVLGLQETREMVRELFEAEARWLPHFEGKLPRKVDLVDVPQGTAGVDVPLDPALAVANRFGKLASD